MTQKLSAFLFESEEDTVLTSIAVILLLGLLAGWLFAKMRLPSLMGMILVGMAISPHALDLVHESVLAVSPDLRQVALVIILTRAGLSLNLADLRRVGRPAALMCFVPACTEMLGTIALAPALLGVSVLDAAIIGSVMAAVSPAVVVPRMIRLMDEGYGQEKRIPQLILAGASVDDVFVIVVFTALTALAATGEVSPASALQIPVSIALGIALGGAVGCALTGFFRRNPMRDSVKVLIMLSVSFLLLEVEARLKGVVPMSGLLAIMSMGIAVNQTDGALAKRLSAKYNKLWLGAEIFLFVLVGVAVNLHYARKAGAAVVALVALALCMRMAGVGLSLVKTGLNRRERLFCAVAYTPKATVQAAIGTVPLAMGLACGEMVLTVAVISILLTAPFGAICIDHLHKRWLEKTASPRA